MKMLISLVMVPVAIVATGCLQEKAYVDPDSNTSVPGGAPSDLNLENGTLSGDFGPRAGFAGSATEMTGVSDREFANSTTTVSRTENGRGTGMMILWTSGAVLEDIEPGSYPIAYDPSALEQATLSANVCSGGSDSSSIDYDAPAEAGNIVVTRTPEGRVFDVHTETPAMDAMGNPTGQIQTADSSFTLVN